MSTEVLVDLPRQVSWRASADAPELAYGPGRALVPKALADSLQEMGLITWQDDKGLAPSWNEVDVIVPSGELAADFPSREYLFLAGHTTYQHVADLTPLQIESLRGVGEARAKQIVEAQAVIKAKLPKPAAPPKTPPESQPTSGGGESRGDPGVIQGEPDGTQPDAE